MKYVGSGRGSGKTTRQMQNAPKDALFIWCNHDLHYPRDLSRKIEREDLTIVSDQWLSRTEKYRGRIFSGVVFDHAFQRRTEREEDDYRRFIQFLQTKGINHET